MRKIYLSLVATLLLVMAGCVSDKTSPTVKSNPTLASAEKLTEGKELNTDNCTKCHNTSVYTKKDRKVKTLSVLTARVQRCNAKTGAGLDEDELKTLTLFLNTEYYKFKK